MKDLIERQAAIDATQGIERLATLPDNDKVIRMSAVEYVLFNLPPAQPEVLAHGEGELSAQTEEDCDTCKHGYFGDACCNNCKVSFPSHYERRTR